MNSKDLRNKIDALLIIHNNYIDEIYDNPIAWKKQPPKTCELLLALIQEYVEGIVNENVNLRADLAGAMGHMQGCGHRWKYLEKRYPELTLDNLKEKGE